MDRRIVQYLIEGKGHRFIKEQLGIGSGRLEKVKQLAEQHGYLSGRPVPAYPEAVFADRSDGRTQQRSDTDRLLEEQVGFIEVAADADRLEEYRRVAAFNRYCGIDVEKISARQVQELFPIARVDDILAGFYVKEDGRANPVDLTMALARGARLQGATILEGVAATGILQQRGGAF